MKQIILAALLLLGASSFAHDLETNGLYKGYEVKDSEGKTLRIKRQEFIKVNGNDLIRINFNELLNMETGEVIVVEKIDTLNLENLQPDLVFNQTSNTSFELVYPTAVLTFKLMENTSTKSPDLDKCKDFLIGNTFVQNDIPKTEEPTLTYTYQENGLAKYQTIGSHSNWETAYKIVAFEGYVFLKGITSAPILITTLEEKRLVGIKADYRFEPKPVELVLQ